MRDKLLNMLLVLGGGVSAIFLGWAIHHIPSVEEFTTARIVIFFLIPIFIIASVGFTIRATPSIKASILVSFIAAAGGVYSFQMYDIYKVRTYWQSNIKAQAKKRNIIFLLI